MITDNRVSKEEFERLRNDQSYVKVIINKINFFNNKVAKEVLNELIIFSKIALFLFKGNLSNEYLQLYPQFKIINCRRFISKC